MRLNFLRKKNLTLTIMFSYDGIYIIIKNKFPRFKMLKNDEIIYGRCKSLRNEWSNGYIVDLIRGWWESINEEVFITNYINAPAGSKPFSTFGDELFINFNVSSDHINSLLHDA